VAIAALALLLLGVALQPGNAKPVKWDDPTAVTPATAAPTTAAEPAPGPARVSVLDILGKVSFAVLLIYGIGFAMSRYRGGLPQPSRRGGAAGGSSVRVREALPLPRREGTLYLVECEGQTLLVGATAQQVSIVWTAAPEGTSSFAPVVAAPEPVPSRVAATYRTAERPAVMQPLAERPLSGRASTQAPRGESEWARERHRLITALMAGE
jgi:flagellar biogenesis protein FliO